MCLSTSMTFVCCVKLLFRTTLRACASLSSSLLHPSAPRPRATNEWRAHSLSVVIVVVAGAVARGALVQPALLLLAAVGVIRAPPLPLCVANDESRRVDALARAPEPAELDQVRESARSVSGRGGTGGGVETHGRLGSSVGSSPSAGAESSTSGSGARMRACGRVRFLII